MAAPRRGAAYRDRHKRATKSAAGRCVQQAKRGENGCACLWKSPYSLHRDLDASKEKRRSQRKATSVASTGHMNLVARATLSPTPFAEKGSQ
eukprot:6177817-Pleurochrysis_carterae.AAC.1